MNLHRTLLTLLLICAGGAATHAQEEAPQVFQALTFYYIPPADTEEEIAVQLHIGEEVVRAEMEARYAEEPVIRPAEAGLQLFRPGADPESARPIGEASFPASWTNILLMVSRSDGGRLKLFPYNMSLSAIPEGTVGFCNFSKQEVAFKVGDESGIIQPLKLHNYTVKTPPDRDNTIEQINLAVQKEGEWESVFRRRIILNKVKRSFVMITPGTSRELNVISFDIPEEPVEGPIQEAPVAEGNQ